MTTLSALGVSVIRSGRTILDNVSVDFEPGSFTAIIGPNGAGKSTLMTALAGLLRPEGGAVFLDHGPLDDMPRRRLAQIRAYLPQNARCEWPITVERVVALGLTPILPAFGRLPAREQELVDRAMAACDLLPFRNQAATTLSGGELARAMLARAIVGDPQILMADEPTAGLDPRHALDAMTRLRGFSRSNRTVIVAMHDLSLALPFADRVIALRDGRLVADGPVDTEVTPELLKELYDVEARVVRDADGMLIRFPNLG